MDPTEVHRLRAGSLHREQITDIRVRAPTELTVSDGGFWKIGRIGGGLGPEPIRLSCSAPEMRKWAKQSVATEFFEISEYY